jgi:hypothetical protein
VVLTEAELGQTLLPESHVLAHRCGYVRPPNAQVAPALLAALDAERARARYKHGVDPLPDSDSNPVARQTYEDMTRLWCDRAFRENRLTYSHVLEEESCEVLTAAARGDLDALESELVQVMAVCARWWDDIQRRRRGAADAAARTRGLADAGAAIGGGR